MKIHIYNKKVIFKYGPLHTTDDRLSTLDVKEWYERLGGKIRSNTEIDFASFFPGKPYGKTALTSTMPSTYLCEGSIWVNFYQPNGRTHILALSVYRDTSGHCPSMGNHFNLFLQYQIDDKPNHTSEIPNRHISLKDGVVIKLVVDNEEVEKVIIKDCS